MEFVIAAAVLAIGLVAAATVYGRGGLASAGGHGTTTTGPGAPVRPREPAPTRTSDAVAEGRSAEIEARARALDERTVTLRREREELDARRAELDAPPGRAHARPRAPLRPLARARPSRRC